MSDVALFIRTDDEELEKAAKKISHPAGLSSVNSNAGGPISSVASHADRIKQAIKNMKAMLGSSTPESAKEHQKPVVDHKGREAGQKAPYSKFGTGVSGDDSSAAENYGKPVVLKKPSQMLGSTGNTKAPSAGTVKKPRK